MTKLESGRSMVEMLGVLAIIGVLSIGGIMGYQMAMTRYKANEVMAAVAQLSTIADTANQGAGLTSTDKIGFDTIQTGATLHGITAEVYKDNIKLTGVSTEIAEAINNIVGAGTCTTANNATTCTLKMSEGKLVKK